MAPKLSSPVVVHVRRALLRRFRIWVQAMSQAEPVHEIDQSWLDLRASKLWIHCKNLGALNHLLGQKSDLNFFWHQEDDYTLTSAGVIWTYPGMEFNHQCVIVVLELIDLLKIKMGDEGNLFGVCSKYVGLI